MIRFDLADSDVAALLSHCQRQATLNYQSASLYARMARDYKPGTKVRNRFLDMSLDLRRKSKLFGRVAAHLEDGYEDARL